jgi:hypothetical protein
LALQIGQGKEIGLTGRMFSVRTLSFDMPRLYATVERIASPMKIQTAPLLKIQLAAPKISVQLQYKRERERE